MRPDKKQLETKSLVIYESPKQKPTNSRPSAHAGVVAHPPLPPLKES